MTIDGSGNVLVKSAAGLGYGTGAGGTVTQATDKSTAVTLNAPTGQITMNNATLNAGASVDFSVTNSVCASTDLVLCNVSNFGNYTVVCKYVAAGSFVLRVTNVSAGNLSEAVVINFAIIKGSAS